ncbi:aspartyl protease family protein [Fulvivirgaceae bacterium BMA10]|uniref:Aspartyl protease family protein n=1 Tax=Splendidivirga corallicola TaxID=3051826 RepID=A0ABT8KRY4_9BACT|nr:aspartyl protease family protein [Fulvivirgaceae bacterium BMA10]
MNLQVRLNTNKLLLGVFLVLIIFPSALAQKRGFHFTGNNQMVEVPFRLVNNLPVIEVKVNESKKLNFIVDTGIRTTILFSKSYIKGLEPEYAQTVRFSGLGSDHLLHGKVAHSFTIDITDRVRANGMAMVILQDAKLKRRFGRANIHGVLGYELFTRFIVEIDYYNKIMTFCDHGYFDFADVYKELPLTIEDTKPYIEADIKLPGESIQRAKFMIDTGFSGTLLFHTNEVPQLLASNSTQPQEVALADGLSGQINGVISRVSQFNIGAMSLKNIPVMVISNKEFDENNKIENRSGSIGGGLFMAYAIAFDYVNNKFYMKRQHKSYRRVVVSL